MMHFIEPTPEPENNNNFWYLIIATSIVSLICIAEIFISFYCEIN